MRQLISAYNNGLNSVPKIIVELGPGDLLGSGLAALISGAEKYYGLDIKKYGSEQVNLKMFDNLVTLYKQKSRIPDENEFPGLRPLLEDYCFPKKKFQ